VLYGNGLNAPSTMSELWEIFVYILVVEME